MSTKGEEKVQKLITESIANVQGRSYHEKQEVVAGIVVALKHNIERLVEDMIDAKMAEIKALEPLRMMLNDHEKQYEIECLNLMSLMLSILTKADDVLKALEKTGVHRG